MEREFKQYAEYASKAVADSRLALVLIFMSHSVSLSALASVTISATFASSVVAFSQCSGWAFKVLTEPWQCKS